MGIAGPSRTLYVIYALTFPFLWDNGLSLISMQSYELSTCVQGKVHLKNLHLFRSYFWLKPCSTVSISSFPRNEIQSSPYVPNRGKKIQ